MPISDDDITAALAILDAAGALDPHDPRYVRLERGVAAMVKSAKKRRRVKRSQAAAAHDRAQLRAADLSVERLGPTAHPPAAPLRRQRTCYACRKPYRRVHDRYHQLCPACGDRSAAARVRTADLTGRRALVTGGRIKIGHAVALSLLRMGCEVHVTTRFPADAARRFAEATDHAQWWDRLHLYGLDFRLLPVVLEQVAAWRAGPPFDILINNAAQTVWHPPAYYHRLLAGEQEPLPFAAPIRCRLTSAQRGQGLVLSEALFPPGEDIQGNPLDLRRANSWVQKLEDIAPIEAIEVQVINAIVPFILCSRLHDSLLRSPHPDRYIVNVTALEGMFRRADKLPRHPHTNMAKAGLNMLTRTSAAQAAEQGIYMVSVDPGWMSHEGPAHQVEAAYATGFHPPLDAEDAAARVLDPVLRGVDGAPIFGVLLKDFEVIEW
jgi:NAD(P)-dependent dehydrogenase (short-subunit alcohol dehydrogenase family)